VRTAAFILAAPLGYLLLTGYLLARIRPLPIALLPESLTEDERLAEALAA
jgi:hypothetical protein